MAVVAYGNVNAIPPWSIQYGLHVVVWSDETVVRLEVVYLLQCVWVQWYGLLDLEDSTERAI